VSASRTRPRLRRSAARPQERSPPISASAVVRRRSLVGDSLVLLLVEDAPVPLLSQSHLCRTGRGIGPGPDEGFGRETKWRGSSAGLCGGLGTLGGVHRALHGGSGIPAREDIDVERRDWCFVKAGLVASSSENVSGLVCAMFSL
jgi:hypothetical protein